MRVESADGTSIHLTDCFAQGGEATIWAVRQQPEVVAKIYHEPTVEKARKIAAMVANPPIGAGRLAVAWPQAVLTQQGRFVGYLMPRVRESVPLFHMMNPARRARLDPLYRPLYPWPYVLHHMARNLAAAVKQIHAAGHVIGDLNESNILIDRHAIVTLVDADSFQIRVVLPEKQGAWAWLGGSTEELHRNAVGKPEFTPPELQGIDFKSIDRTIEHDHFGLAVLIFYLIMDGHHPYAGILHSRRSVGRVDLHCMRQGIFPYHANLTAYPPPGAPPYQWIHPDLRHAFGRAFVSGHGRPKVRPTAQEWLGILDETANQLVPCTHERDHFYFTHLPVCPHCEPTAAPRPRLTHQRVGAWWWQGQSVLWRFVGQLGIWLNFLVQHLLNVIIEGPKNVKAIGHPQTWSRQGAVLSDGLQWTLMSWGGASLGALLAWLFFAQLPFAEAWLSPFSSLPFGALFVGLGSTLAQRPLLGKQLTRLSRTKRQQWLNGWVIGSSAAFFTGGLLVEWLFGLSTQIGADQVTPNQVSAEAYALFLPAALFMGLMVGFIQSWWMGRHFQRAGDQRTWTAATGLTWLLTGGGYLVGSQTDQFLPVNELSQAIIAASVANLCGALLIGMMFVWFATGPSRAIQSRRHPFYAQYRSSVMERFRGRGIPRDRLRQQGERWGKMFLLVALLYGAVQGVVYWFLLP